MNDLSYDPRDPLFRLPGRSGVRWGLQVFTTANVYGLAAESVSETFAPSGVAVTATELSWAGQQKRASGSVHVVVACDDGLATWSARVECDEKVKAVKLFLTDLPFGPDRGTTLWHATSRPDELLESSPGVPILLRYPYPDWQTPWACVQGATSAVALSVRDTQIRAKRLYAHVPPTVRNPVIELIAEEDARVWSNSMTAPQFRMRLCTSSDEITGDFNDHLAFVEGAYELPRWEARSDVPQWFRDVRLVLNLHGQHWTGFVFNTYDQMAEVLEFASQQVAGHRLLAFLAGWEGRYYFDYPNYRPSDDLGGERGLNRLVRTAHRLGVHVMAMFGATGANATQYADWRRAVLRNRTNRYAELVNRPDWDGDRSGEDDQIFLNPGEPRFRRHLVGQIHRIVEAYRVDAIFLDVSGVWFNDPRHGMYRGYRNLVRDLRRRHPGLLIAGEGWWDGLLGLLPVNQTWADPAAGARLPQLLTRYGRTIGHLKEPAPGLGSTGVEETGFRRPTSKHPPVAEHIPAIGVVDDTLSDHRDEFAILCRSALAGEPRP